MRIVVDANILVGQLSRAQGRSLLTHPDLQLLMTERAWDEAWYEFPRRLERRVVAKTFSIEAVEETLAITHAIAAQYVRSYRRTSLLPMRKKPAGVFPMIRMIGIPLPLLSQRMQAYGPRIAISSVAE